MGVTTAGVRSADCASTATYPRSAAMSHDPTKDHVEYGKLRAGGAYATQHFVEATEMDEAAIDPETDIESNELVSPDDELCAHCGRPIAPGSEVRRTATRGYAHEVC